MRNICFIEIRPGRRMRCKQSRCYRRSSTTKFEANNFNYIAPICFIEVQYLVVTRLNSEKIIFEKLYIVEKESSHKIRSYKQLIKLLKTIIYP